jgi:hypothetical protein
VRWSLYDTSRFFSFLVSDSQKVELKRLINQHFQQQLDK